MHVVITGASAGVGRVVARMFRDMRVGEARVTIRFRERSWEVREKQGTLHIVQQPMPWSLTATRKERLVDVLRSLVK